MKSLEAREFYEKRVFGLLPGVKSWIDSRENAASVYLFWFEALEDVDVADAEFVLKDFAKGNVAIPASWEFGPKFVALCNLEKGKRLRLQNSDQLRDELSNRSSGAMDHVKGFAIWEEVWKPLLAAVERGEITSNFAHQQWNQVLDRQFGTNREQGYV
jgi:hypothetical protein